MTKNRIFIILITIIVIAGVIIGISKIYINTKYSADKIAELLGSQNELPTNVYIEENFFNNETEQSYSVTKTYIKDNVVYTHQDTKSQNIEALYDFNKNELIVIVHDFKSVTYYTISESDKKHILSNYFNHEWIKEHKEQYKYLGKEKIDDKIYIKFLITDDDIKEIFYIDVENMHISKIESYEKDNNDYKLESTINFKYLYNVVKDEDILKFDSSSYPDYVVHGETNE